MTVIPKLAPLLAASAAIKLHVLFVAAALAITAFIFLRAKGTMQHRVAGYAWVVAMAGTALSSFWISEIDLFAGFSPIHVISVFVLVQIVVGIRAARRRAVKIHRRVMTGMVWGGLGIAGALSFMPDRIMFAVIAGG